MKIIMTQIYSKILVQSGTGEQLEQDMLYLANSNQFQQTKMLR